tara:strand:+ start:476 stop:1411 length:936 start_codon:yes stop_codon:yes gene_type:complete
MKRKPINMATGGLMSMPPYIKDNDKSDDGITPYDVNTPDSARKGLPSRLLGKSRTRFGAGDVVENISVKDKLINKQIQKLNNMKEVTEVSEHSNIDNQIQKLESMKSSKVKKALGGYMDENDIAEQTPLALNIGGAVSRQDERKDYKAYAEGDLVEDEIVEEPLMVPTGMEEEPLIADEMAADTMAEEDMVSEDEDMMDADAILDTSMLSEEEEIVLDEAVEMHPELESIIPKIVATEFTEDELVEGPGDGTSDSIPAMLSDGEFVFTAKAVKSLGVDKLRKMMAQAEEAYDAGQVSQEEAALGAEESLLA